MGIQEGDFISLKYTGRVGDNIFDTTDEEVAKEEGLHNPRAEYGPVTIRLGSHHVILGLEEALVGKEVGDEGEIEVPPEKAFGEHDDSLMRSVPVTQFREKPRIGTRVELESREGTVINIIGRRAVVDFNHALAGKTLAYDYKILEKVDDPVEQVSGLIRLYAGRSDIGVAFIDGTVELTLPAAITYDRRWMVWRGTLIREVFEYYPRINDIVMKETFTRPEVPGTADEVVPEEAEITENEE
jgi:FKBP-type peptidyl-prolyl cis-trans isomerase SlyD